MELHASEPSSTVGRDKEEKKDTLHHRRDSLRQGAEGVNRVGCAGWQRDGGEISPGKSQTAPWISMKKYRSEEFKIPLDSPG